MPTRVLREGILDSEAVNALSFAAEVFYRRLMSVVDDFGRFDGRAQVLRSRLYPLRIDTVREADIARWIAECEKAGLIVLYAVDRKPYILFRKLGSPRAKDSKFPPPPSDCENANRHLYTDAYSRAQTHADVPYSGSGSGSNSGSSSIAPGGDPPGDVKPPKKTPRPPKPRDELFDAVAEVSGSDATVAASHVAKVRHALAAAVPPYTPADVREFGRRFAELCPWAAKDGRTRPTLGEITKYIGTLRATNATNPTRGSVGRPGRADARPGKYDDLDAGAPVARGPDGPDLFGPAGTAS